MRRLAARLGAALAILTLAAAAVAAAPVRTGEHDGFTRIVIEYVAPPGWSVMAVEGGWEFRAAGDGPGFDLSGAWNLIGRARVTDLTAAGSDVLRIASDCDCHVEAWSFRDVIPVIDVYDGPPPPGGTGIARYRPHDGTMLAGEDSEDTEAVAAAAPARDDPAHPAEPVLDLPDPLEPEIADGLARAVDQAAGAAPDDKAVAELELDLELDAAARRRAAELEARLAEALGRAGAQDILEPADTDAGAARPEPPMEVAEPAGAEADVLPQPDPPAGDSQVRIETVVDRDRADALPPGAGLTADGTICPDPHSLDLATWGTLADGRPDFARWTGQLTGELDTLEPQALERAARFYLYLGFGAEAAQLAGLLPPAPAREQLLGLAALLEDNGTAGAGGQLRQWSSCGNAAALWGVLASGALERGEVVDRGAVLTAFRALPPHLRALIAPRLIVIFVDVGDSETAQQIRNSIELAPAEAGASATLAAALLEESLANPDRAEQLLAEALRTQTPDSAELQLELVRRRMARGVLPTEAEFGALEAHAYELRGQPLALDLHRTLAEAEIMQGRFRAAADRLSGALRDEDEGALWRRLYLQLAERAAPPELLRLALPPLPALGWADEDMEVRIRLADRLLGLGFAGETLALLQPGPGMQMTGPTPAAEWPLAGEAQLLAARAELALDQPAAVLARLADRQDADSHALVAAAHELLGDLAAARRFYLLAGQADEVRRIDLLQGAWLTDGVAESLPPGAAGDTSEMVGNASEDEGDVPEGNSGPQDDPTADRTGDAGDAVAARRVQEGEEAEDIHARGRRLLERSAEDRAEVSIMLTGS